MSNFRISELKYETLGIQKGTILGVYPGDIFYPESLTTTVTPYYMANGAREILSKCQYRRSNFTKVNVLRKATVKAEGS